MLAHVLDTLESAGIDRSVVVTGHGADAVEAAVEGRASCIRQQPQRGTADAVRVALDAVPTDADEVIVTMGDVPLQPAELVTELLAARRAAGAADGAGRRDPRGADRLRAHRARHGPCGHGHRGRGRRR